MHPGRKPVHLTVASGKPQGRQAIWSEIRAQREAFGIDSLVAATGIHRDTIRTYLQGLDAAGYIEQLMPSPEGPPISWRLVKDVGAETPRVTKDGKPVTQGAVTDNMWRTMKMWSGDFSWRDLAIAATTETVTVDESYAKDYCQNLVKAGYLLVAAKGKGIGKGAVPSRYRFNRTKNTGPRPPMIQRLKSVFDPNLGKIVWQEAPRDE